MLQDRPLIRWGILATGNIAEKFAKGVCEASNSKVVAVAARDLARAKTFSLKHGIDRSYGNYNELLEDRSIDAVYIATLHPFHYEWIIKAIQEGKHVLCEKPLTMNHREAKHVQSFAAEKRKLLREAFMYRHHPQTQCVVDWVEAGRIGKVRFIEASFCFDSGIQPDSRLQARELGGGGILDLGCYTMSFARLIAGRANRRLFSEPLELKAVGHLDSDTKTDMWTSAVVRFEGDIVARLSVALRQNCENHAIIWGEKGRILVDSPWFAQGSVRLDVEGQEEVVVAADLSRSLYAYEVESFAGELQGKVIAPREVAMRINDSVGNMQALDRWRAEIGLAYEADRSV